ncbi:threonine/serine dehydratase [Propionibacteriaceae bacterium Y1685]
MMPTPSEIVAAYELIEPHIRRTPCMDYELPDRTQITLKLELLQHAGSFKPRGAFFSVLSATEKPERLVAASGGSHGMAVAYAGLRLGIPTTIFVPTTAPAAKVSRLHAFGADVRLVGSTYAEAHEACLPEARRHGSLEIHAYDGSPTVTGQGTIGLEIEEQSEPDTILVACGGGGLMGGLASWFGRRAKIIAVEPETCPAYAAALAEDRPVPTRPSGIAADALGASTLGAVPWSAAKAAGVESLLVSDSDIAAARAHIWRSTRLVAEPGGATALAPLLSGAYVPADGERVTVIVCGSNTDPATLPMD